MDSYEATQIVFSRIQSLDPENVSKIMGYLLLQDNDDKEMIRLALGPQTLLQSLIFKVKEELGLMLRSPAGSNYLARVDRPHLPLQSQLVFSSPTALSPHAVSSWGSQPQQNNKPLPTSSHGIVPDEQNYSNNGDNNGYFNFGLPSLPDQVNKLAGSYTNEQLINGPGDDFQLQDQRSFVNESPKSNNSHAYASHYHHPETQAAYFSGLNPLSMDYRRIINCATSNGVKGPNSTIADICVASEYGISSVACKPCMYFARGYCKNGSNCRFLHSSARPESDSVIGIEEGQAARPLENFDLEFHEYLRGKRSPVPIASLPHLSNDRFGIVALQAGKNTWTENSRIHGQHTALLAEDAQKFTRSRNERDNYLTGVGINAGSRQIYLTFPADSNFSEVDVSNYFSIYGPVQDVRIPYQQKRMFGFVTFVYPGTVKMILAKGNPHYVCDARVLVKPYREKGKPALDRKYNERGQYSGYVTVSNLEIKDYQSKDCNWYYGPPRLLDNTEAMRSQQNVERTIELQARQLAELHLVNDAENLVTDRPREDSIAATTGPIVNQAGHQKSNLSNGLAELPSHEEAAKLASEDVNNSTISDHFGYLLQVLDSPTYEERPKHLDYQQERAQLESTQVISSRSKPKAVVNISSQITELVDGEDREEITLICGIY